MHMGNLNCEHSRVVARHTESDCRSWEIDGDGSVSSISITEFPLFISPKGGGFFLLSSAVTSH